MAGDFDLALLKYISREKDPLNAVLSFLSQDGINWTSQFFSRMRAWQECLQFVAFCRSILGEHRTDLPTSEMNRLDAALISYELAAYDGLDLWESYVELFERTRREKAYTITYANYRNDETFNQYVLREDSKHKYVHFLYLSDHRYQIIKRKLERKRAGRSTSHLQRQKQTQLTQFEYDERHKEMMGLLEWMKGLV